MILCQCNVILRREIEEVIIDLLHEDPWQLIVPGTVYRALGKRGKCCGCFPNVVDVIAETTEAYHRGNETPDADIIPLIGRLKEQRQRLADARKASRQKQAARRAKRHSA
ncbi:MAG: hypothetical protein AB7L41_16730 [Flavobacteriaceae bacterium]